MQYADDTGRDFTDTRKKSKHNTKSKNWFTANKLCFNEDEPCEMIFALRNDKIQK